MTRFLTGLFCGVAFAMLARAIDATEPWWLFVGLTTAAGVWFADRTITRRKDQR